MNDWIFLSTDGDRGRPLLESVDTKTGSQNIALAESLTQAFLRMREPFMPNDRAAFLLRTVFDFDVDGNVSYEAVEAKIQQV